MDDRERIKEIKEINERNKQEAKEEKIRKRKKTLSRLASVVAGTVFVSAAATEMMLFVMFGRKNTTNTGDFPLQQWAEERGLFWHEVAYESDGNTLRGYLVTGANPKTFIVIAHGVNASSDGFEPVVQYFAERNYAVLIFDGTASGRSEGANVVGLQQQRFDVRATMKYVRQQGLFKGVPLVLLGHSAGAYGVAMEAERSGASAVVCLSGFRAPLDTMRHWARRYTSVLADIEYPFLWARQRLSLGDETNEPADEELISCGIPAFVGQGSNDETVEDEISLLYHLLDENPKNVSFFMEEDPNFNGHDNILFNDGVANTVLLDKIDNFIQSVI